ncbi:hypothetical protein NUITMVRE34_10990 [Enterococcus gallinarum]|uniref:GNAT family N-acetyltransferase n=1 Tax=Enterococcus gallinarum TaxID=1353 RepID=UPI0028FDB874|nr:hypothetical protein NUITMVRE34_10990 [Enterococcus gallinarum]GMS50965.1 hypothetical protein NUITMVRE35_11000 [Enterococcus gallinarum]
MNEEEYSIIPVNSLIENEQLDSFTCGNETEELKINDFLKNQSKVFDSRGISKTFLYMRDKELVGFFSLCTSETQVTKKFKQTKLLNRTFSLPISPTIFPSIELTYFAIKHSEQNKKLGTSMMYAILEMLYYNVYLYVGFIMVTLESRNVATEFYEKMGFTHHKTRSGNDRLMALTITDIETILGMST